MHRQMARRSRLIALVKKNRSSHEFYELLLQHITKDTEINPDQPLKLNSDVRSKAILASASPFSQAWHYNKLIQYLRDSTQQPWRSLADNPYGEDPHWIVPPVALQLSHLTYRDRTYATQLSHRGNSGVLYRTYTQQQMTGQINHIWQIPLNEYLHTYFLVERHQLLPPAEERKAPFVQYADQLKTRLVHSKASYQFDIIRPQDIVSHLTVWQRAAGTYGIEVATLLLCWGLDRNR